MPSIAVLPPPIATRIATLVGLVALVWLAFSGALGNGWIFLDDHEYVTHNAHVRAGLTWEGFTWFLHTIHVGNWHPLTSWSHMLDVELFGLDPRGPHVVNVTLHALNTVLLALVLSAYTRRWWPSVCIAALFAVHPLRVESVVWVSERKDVLSGLFFVLTLWAWKRWIDRPSVRRYALVLLAYVLGLMAKPMLVTLPCLLLVLDFWPLRRNSDWRARIVEKLPLAVPMVASIVVTVLAQSWSGATADLGDISMADRAATAVKAYALYLADTFAPHDLAPMYPYRHADGLALPLLVLSGIVLISFVLVWMRRAHPHLLTGWWWYLGILVPVIGLLQVGSQSHADRYTYLPSIGIAIAAVFEVASWIERRPALRVPALVALTGALVACTLMTRTQTNLWRDSRTLFDHTLRVTRDNPTAQKIYGDALLEEGDFKGALPYYAEMLRLAPQIQNGHKNMGCALARLGRFEEAAEQFRLAVEADPVRENQVNLGWALGDAGRFSEAVAPLSRAVELDGDDASTRARLGMVLGELGRFQEALPHLVRAVELAPAELDARRALATTYGAAGDTESAVAEFRRVLERDPNDIQALVNIARIRSTHAEAAHRNAVEALQCAERARDVAPVPFSFLYGALASAYAESGRFEDAVRAAARAVELARAEGDEAAVSRYEAQLAEHRAGRPFRTH